MEIDREHGPDIRVRMRRLRTGAAWLDLVATVGAAYGPVPVERLDGVAALRGWLAAESLVPDEDLTELDLVRARDLREALRALALAAMGSEPWPAGQAARINEILAADRPLELEAGTQAVRRPATAREALARVARQAADQLTGPAAADLRRCANPECGMLFLDSGGRRRWCADDVCGVRSRVRAHRRRRKAPDV